MPDRYYILEGPTEAPVVIAEVIAYPSFVDGDASPDLTVEMNWNRSTRQDVKSGTELSRTAEGRRALQDWTSRDDSRWISIARADFTRLAAENLHEMAQQGDERATAIIDGLGDEALGYLARQ